MKSFNILINNNSNTFFRELSYQAELATFKAQVMKAAHLEEKSLINVKIHSENALHEKDNQITDLYQRLAESSSK